MAPKQVVVVAGLGGGKGSLQRALQSGLGGGKGVEETGLGGSKGCKGTAPVGGKGQGAAPFLPEVVDLDPEESNSVPSTDIGRGGGVASPSPTAPPSPTAMELLRTANPDLWSPGYVPVTARAEFWPNYVPPGGKPRSSGASGSVAGIAPAEPGVPKESGRGGGGQEPCDLPNDSVRGGDDQKRRDLSNDFGRGDGQKESSDLPVKSVRGGGEKRHRRRPCLKDRLLDALFSTMDGDVDIVVPGQDAACLLKLGLGWDDLVPVLPEGAPADCWQVYSTSVEVQKAVTDRASWARWQGRVRAWVGRNLKDDDCSALVENPGADDRLFLGWCLAFWLEPTKGAWRRWPLKRRLQGLSLVTAHWDVHGHGRASASDPDSSPDLGPTPPSPGAEAAVAAKPQSSSRRRKLADVSE